MAPRPTILIVDDNETNVQILQEILEADYELLTATNSRDAIALSSLHLPRLVLLDVMLPDVDGYETCRRLRHILPMRNARIIMVSAKAMPSERAKGLNAGADAYVTKPFDEADLLAAIQAHPRSGIDRQ